MADLRVADQDLASRRGLLLGMTLAEVMLIVLFCLLLLLGKSFIELEQYSSWRIKEKEHTLIEAFLNETWNARKDNPSEFWRIMSTGAKNMSSDGTGGQSGIDISSLLEEISRLREKNVQLEEEIAQLKEENEQLEEKLDEATDQIAALTEEMRKLQAGSPPPCLYENGSVAGEIRGASISLGVVHVEDGYITLISKNSENLGLDTVDFIGRPAAYIEKVNSILLDWPEGERMNPEEFGEYGNKYLQIGDDESNDKLKCRFTMDYYIEDVGVPYDMFIKVFQGYFYKQRRLERDEFTRIQ